MNGINVNMNLKEKMNCLKDNLFKKIEKENDKNKKRKVLYQLIGIDTMLTYIYDINASILICKDNINIELSCGENPQALRNTLTKKYFSLQDNMSKINQISIDTFQNNDCIIFNTKTREQLDASRLEIKSSFSKEEIKSIDLELDAIYEKYEEFLKKQNNSTSY